MGCIVFILFGWFWMAVKALFNQLEKKRLIEDRKELDEVLNWKPKQRS